MNRIKVSTFGCSFRFFPSYLTSHQRQFVLFKIEEEYKWKIKDINSASQITAVSPNISDLNAIIFLGNLLEFPC